MLFELRNIGRCSVSVLEFVFDLDVFGYYFWWLCSVVVMILCVVGFYVIVVCMFILFVSTVWISFVDLVGYFWFVEGEDDWFSDYYGV